jgi:Holliday junction resolvase RusA-like endonuclease
MTSGAPAAKLPRLPLAFTVPITPFGKARARITARGNYTPTKTADLERMIAMFARSAFKGRKPFAGAVELVIQFDVPIPPSWSKRKRADALNRTLLPTSKPDLDNMVKAVGDAMNKIAYADDSQVAFLTARKFYAAVGCIHVTITALTE